MKHPLDPRNVSSPLASADAGRQLFATQTRPDSQSSPLEQLSPCARAGGSGAQTPQL